MELPKLIRTWKELKECKSETHILKIKDGSGWIEPKVVKDPNSWEGYHYLSTHTFYNMGHKYYTQVLQECGFDVELANWDELGW